MTAPVSAAITSRSRDTKDPLRSPQVVLLSSSQLPFDLYRRLGGTTSRVLSHLYNSQDSSSDIIIMQQPKPLQPLLKIKTRILVLLTTMTDNFIGMDNIRDIYKTVTRAPEGGVQGYYLHSSYFDARKSRQQKILASSKDRSPPLNVAPKTNFLDDLCKKAGRLPGPTTYEPYNYERKSSKNLKSQSPPRVTIFQEMEKIQKKLNIPAAGSYDKVQVKVDSTIKLRSPMSRAETGSFYEDYMRKSIELPGVGNYTPRINVFDAKGAPKWKEDKQLGKKRSESQRGIKAPEAATYNPAPVAFDLFSSMSSHKAKSRSYFGREQRFKSEREKPVPFYNIGSEWGLNDKKTTKDILRRVGSSVTHQSIYY